MFANVKNKDSKMEEKIYAVLRKHRLPLKKREELMPDLLALLDVVKSSYCECTAPIVRSSVNMDEYCGNCGKDIDQ